jgi:RimJ/RimL family protein N-acetyltransferase
MSEVHADLLWQLDQDPEVMRFLNGGKVTSRTELEQRFLPRMAAYRDPFNGWGLWQSVEKVSGEFLGWTLVRPMGFFTDRRDDSDLELGWRYKRSSWGNGYATEAAYAIMMAIRQQTGITRFSATVAEENTASIAIMKKLGMSYLKTDHNYPGPNGPETALYYTVSLE